MLNQAEEGLGREAPGLRAGRAAVFGWQTVSQQHPVLGAHMGTYLDGRGSLGKEKRERVQG